MNTGSASQPVNDLPPKSAVVIHLKSYDRQCILEAYAILSQDPPPQISIEGLALEVGLNRTKLQYGFKQLYGINIYDFQVQKRMEKAKLLLITTDKPVKAIAPLSGYRSSSSFGAEFKKLFGITPLQFRKQGLESGQQHT